MARSTPSASSTGFHRGLRKVGQFWHYHLKIHGKGFHGSTGCTDLDSARAFLEDVRLEAIAEHRRPGSSILVRDAVATWLTHLNSRGLSTRHQELAVAAMDRVVLPVIGAIAMGDLAQGHVDQLLAKARSQTTRWGHPWADASVNQSLAYARNFLNWGRKRDLLRRTLTVELVGDTEPPMRSTLTEEQLTAFLGAIDERGDRGLSLCVRAMVFLGLRVSEALAMEWIRWESKNRIYTPDIKTTKNRKHKPLPVPDELAAMIDAQPVVGAFIVPGVDGQLRGRRALYHLVRRVAAKLGIEKFSPHGLRRTLGTLLAETGINPKVLQAAMRHSSINVTFRHYVKGEAEQARSAINTLSSTLDGTTTGPVNNVTPLLKTGTGGGREGVGQ